MAILERNFQPKLIKEIKERFPNSIVFKLDPKQGFPDLLILHGDRWAALECKRDPDAHRQPNQEYYVGLLNQMSYSRFVYPSNKDDVLKDLERHFNFYYPSGLKGEKR